MINPIGNSYNTTVYPYNNANKLNQAPEAVDKITGVKPVTQKSNPQVEKVKSTECQTCKSRKYMDHSGEGNVSFKSPTHVSPQASFSAVSAHEQEHVSNAVSEGSKEGNQLVNASVKLKMAVCPECGRSYVAGGTTTTTIKYNTKNPYENERKSLESSVLKGSNFDKVA